MKRDEYLQKTKDRIPSYDFDHGVFYLDYSGHRVQSKDISVFFIFSTTPSLIQFLNAVNGVTTTSSGSENCEKETEDCQSLSFNTTMMTAEMVDDSNNGGRQETKINGGDEGEEILQPSLVQPLLPSSVITTTATTTILSPPSSSSHPPSPPPPSPSAYSSQLETPHVPPLSISASNTSSNTDTVLMTVDYWEELENREREKRWRNGYRELSYICLYNSHIVCP